MTDSQYDCIARHIDITTMIYMYSVQIFESFPPEIFKKIEPWFSNSSKKAGWPAKKKKLIANAQPEAPLESFRPEILKKYNLSLRPNH